MTTLDVLLDPWFSTGDPVDDDEDTYGNMNARGEPKKSHAGYAEEYAEIKNNNLHGELGKSAMHLLYDLFISTTGPRFRFVSFRSLRGR